MVLENPGLEEIAWSLKHEKRKAERSKPIENAPLSHR
jgi:hypothetical protein